MGMHKFDETNPSILSLDECAKPSMITYCFAEMQLGGRGINMICSYCAAEMPDISGFCPDCGRSVAYGSVHAVAADFSQALLGALAYIGLLPAVVMLVVPATRRREFVRFHCWQSLVFTAAAALAAIAVKFFFLVFSMLPVVGFLFSWLVLGVVSIALLVWWLVLVAKALQGDSYEFPLLGPLAMRLTDMSRPAVTPATW
jgi:uncharacterized membrane protein